jgi:endonuclease G, mitochondrial
MGKQIDTAKAISIDPNYSDRKGYNPAFLGTGERRVPLPTLTPAMRANVAPVNPPAGGSRSYVLNYHHYSVVMNKQRRLAWFTAVNVDGTAIQEVKRETDRWSYDPRVDRACQIGPELYNKNDLDFGHLTRRLDAAWGSDPISARTANDDTFHYTNCCPQHKLFNRNKSTWAGLEDYIFHNALAERMKVTVFTGPVFQDDDPTYRTVQLPRLYWKLVVMVRQDGSLSATAYKLDQSQLLPDLTKGIFSFGEYKTYQVAVSNIQALTGLRFGRLAQHDPLANVKSLFTQELASPADVVW